MGLINREQRARAKAAKAERRKAIVEAALHCFTTQPFSEVSLDTIANRAKVPMGTPSLYFGGKQELFLHIAGESFEEWFAALAAALTGEEGPVAPSQLAQLLARSLGEREQLAALNGDLHLPLELQVESLALRGFHEQLLEGLEGVGRVIEDTCPVCARGEGLPLLRRFLAVAAGLEQSARSRGARYEILDQGRFAAFKVDFRRELETLAERLLGVHES